MAYADEQVRIGVGRAHRLYVVAETTFGTLVEPSGTDLVLSTSGHIPDQAYNYIDDAQKRNERSRRQQIKLKLGVGTIGWDMYLKVPSASKTYPECTDVLEGLFGAKSQSIANDTTEASCSTTVLKTTGGGSSFAVGQAVAVDVSATSTPSYEVAFITSILTNELTVSPPLTVAPVAGKIVYASTNYSLTNSPGSYSIWVEETDFGGETGGVKALAGCKFGAATFKFAGNEPAGVSVEATYREQIKCGRDMLAATVSDTTTTSITVTDASKFDAKAIILIGSEAMLITSIAYATNVLTVTRGYKSTTPAAHNWNLTVTPWLPTGVEVGVPIGGYLGKVRSGTTGAIADVVSAEIKVDQKPKWIEDTKDNTELPNQAIYPDYRETSLSAKLYYSQQHQKLWRDAEQQTSSAWMVPAGNTPGKIVAMYLPNVDIKRPKISGDGEQQIDVEGYPYATSAGNDEVRLAFI